MPSAACTETALAGNVLSGVEVASTIRSIDSRIDLRVGERRARRRNAEVGGHLAVRRDVARADAGALHDPFVGGVDHPRQIVIAEAALRQVAAAAEDDRTCHGHEAAPRLCSPRLPRGHGAAAYR